MQWDVVDQVKGLSFDTTSTNTGIKSGAAILLEKKFGRKLIHLPCRHHIYEIILRSVFETKISSTSAPEVSLFERFAKSWPNLNKEAFESSIGDRIISEQINVTEVSVLKEFCLEKLTETQIRDDYKELLQLALNFIGAERYKFRSPGPTSHARWMSKAIYVLKIFLFRKQFQLSASEISGLRDICIFLIKIYIKAWFGCTNAIDAPFQDLLFVQNSIAYKSTDPEVATAIQKKISNHLWYLGEESVALGFFDSRISHEEKRKMVKRLKFKEPVIKLKNSRHFSDLSNFHNYSLSDFISEKTKTFFTTFGLSTNFFSSDPSLWENTLDFEDGWTYCKNLFVVNDTAERGVKFMQDFNKVLTNNEEEQQLLLQVVEAYRNKYPNYKKISLL